MAANKSLGIYPQAGSSRRGVRGREERQEKRGGGAKGRRGGDERSETDCGDVEYVETECEGD